MTDDPMAMMDQPTVEEVERIIRSDVLRCYRIDIETDSTVRADVSRQQENVSQFVQGFAAFVTAIGPAVEARVMPLDVATDLLTGFARIFKLGRQAEDALERLGKQAKEPRQPAPDPAAQADAAKVQLEQAKLQVTAGESQGRLTLDTEKAKADAAVKLKELDLKERELVLKERKMALDEQARAQELDLKNKDMQLRATMDVAKLEDGQAARADQGRQAELERRAKGMQPETYEEAMKEVAAAIMAMAEAMKQLAEIQQQQSEAMLAAITAPKTVVRGKSGRVEGVRTVLN